MVWSVNAGKWRMCSSFRCLMETWIFEPLASLSSLLFLGTALRTIVEKIPSPKEDKLGLTVQLHHLYLMQDQCLEVSACSVPVWRMWLAAASCGHSPLDWRSQQDVVLTRILFHSCIMKEPLDLLEVVFPPVFLNS
ncbi:unnamed protein product [Pipistrellus nathusii]|uniref:Uncharacterized protein n=1 Tax=Pipistrellus nathusii TaxID=59473 RepID=A0ABN9ZVA3_PIPNA